MVNTYNPVNDGQLDRWGWVRRNRLTTRSHYFPLKSAWAGIFAVNDEAVRRRTCGLPHPLRLSKGGWPIQA